MLFSYYVVWDTFARLSNTCLKKQIRITRRDLKMQDFMDSSKKLKVQILGLLFDSKIISFFCMLLHTHKQDCLIHSCSSVL